MTKTVLEECTNDILACTNRWSKDMEEKSKGVFNKKNKNNENLIPG